MSEAIKPSPSRKSRFGRTWIYFCGLFLFGFGLAGYYVLLPVPIDKALAQESLHVQAEECCQAMVQDDHSTLVDRSLPYLVEMMGGRERYIARLKTFASEMKKSGVHAREMTVYQPEEFQQKSGVLYGVVAYKMLLKGPLFLSRTISGQLIGISKDRGKNWSFFDCTALKGDRIKIKSVIPDFPDELQLPLNETKE